MKKCVSKFISMIFILGFLFSISSCSLDSLLNGLGKTGTNVFAGSNDSIAAKNAENVKSVLENSELNNEEKAREKADKLSSTLSGIESIEDFTFDNGLSSLKEVLDSLSMSQTDYDNIMTEISKSLTDKTGKDKLEEMFNNFELGIETKNVYSTAINCFKEIIEKSGVDLKIGTVKVSDKEVSLLSIIEAKTEASDIKTCDIILFSMFGRALSDSIAEIEETVSELVDFDSYCNSVTSGDSAKKILSESKLVTKVIDLIEIAELLEGGSTFKTMFEDIEDVLISDSSK